MEIPVQVNHRDKKLIESNELQFDPEWVAILQRTHNLLQTHPGHAKLPQTMDRVTEQVSSLLIIPLLLCMYIQLIIFMFL